MPRLRFAMVCASNNNRSMEAHALLQKEGFEVRSFGVAGHVKLPGSSPKDANVYPFGTPYKQMFEDLQKKNMELYTRNGLLRMLERNMQIKTAPEKWQDCKETFDVVVTFEERVMAQLIEDMNKRDQVTMRALLVVNIDVKDNHTEAAKVAPQTLRLCAMLQEVDDWEDEVDDVITQWEQETGRRATYTICFY